MSVSSLFRGRQLSTFVMSWAFLNVVETFAAENVSAPPNVILVMTDDQGWGDTGYNGHPHLKTPHLDQMCRDGLRFDRWYAAAPVCSPTRGSCLTGRHPYRYGILSANRGHIKSDELTLAELLHHHGFVTGHFGKWHLGTLSKTVTESNRGGPRGAMHYAPPWDSGFDVSFSTEAKVPTWDPMLRPKQSPNRNVWWEPVEDESSAEHYGTHYWSDGQMVTDNLRGDDSRIIMDRAIPFVRQAVRRGQPFFAVIWFHAPHLPVVAGPEYCSLYRQFNQHAQHYMGCITAMDEQVGRLREELSRLGVGGRTMLWFSSDNGPEGNDRSPGRSGGLRGRKRSLWEGGVRVPGLLVWPDRVKPGSVTRVPCATIDYLPTILEVLGADMPDGRPLDGVSLSPIIDGTMKERPRPIGFQSGKQRTLVGNRYKIVDRAGVRGPIAKRPRTPEGIARNPRVPDNPTFHLFDLVDDPGETNDISAEHPAIVEKMARALNAWQQSCRESAKGDDY